MKHCFSILLLFLWAITAQAQPEKIRLALNWKAEPEFGGFYAALLKDFYKNKNLDVEIIQGGSGTPTIQMLANDKIDFAIVSADEVIISHDRKSKNKIKGLFSVYQKSPHIIMTHEERKFSSLSEVWQSDGLLSLQSGLPYFQFLVKKLGKPKVKIVPYLGGVGNFLADKKFSQQGFISTEPVTAEKGGAKTKNFVIADEGFNPYLVVVAATENQILKHPARTKRFIQATREGWQDYLKAPLKTNEYMAKLNKSLDLETFNKGALLQQDFIRGNKVELGSMTKERWNELAGQLLELKIVKKAPEADDLFVENIEKLDQAFQTH